MQAKEGSTTTSEEEEEDASDDTDRRERKNEKREKEREKTKGRAGTEGRREGCVRTAKDMISRRGVASEVATDEVGVRTGKGEEEAAEEEEEEEKEEKRQQQQQQHQLEERAGTEVPVGEGIICKGRQQGGGGGGGVGGSVWSSLVSGTFAILEGRTEVEGGGGGGGGWDFGVKRVVQCGPMRRLQERFLGQKWYTTAASASGSAIWVLGVCYNISSTDESASSPVIFQEFLNDFSSRLWFTYRRGLSVCLLHVLTSFFASLVCATISFFVYEEGWWSEGLVNLVS